MSQAAQLGQSRASYLPTVTLNVSRSVDDTRATNSAGNFTTTNNTHVLATGKVAAANARARRGLQRL
jgi:outer membrane protein TolC